MSKRGKEVLGANMERTLRDGPRLRYDTQTAVVATCKATKRCLLTGLGAMGVGTMWADLDGDYPARAVKDEAQDFPTEDEASVWWHKQMWGGL